MKMVLNFLKKYQSRLIFAACFWAVVLFALQAFWPAAKESLATQTLLRVHASGVPYLNSYMRLGRCDNRFPLDILTKLIALSHLEQKALSKIDFKWVNKDANFSYGLFSYVSKHQDYEKAITSLGGFMKLNNSSDCLGTIQ